MSSIQLMVGSVNGTAEYASEALETEVTAWGLLLASQYLAEAA